MHCKGLGQKVKGFGEKVLKEGGGDATDLDVVTDFWVGNVKASTTQLKKLEPFDMQVLLTKAQNSGLAPKILVPQGTVIPSNVLKLLLKYPQVTIEYFVQGI